MNLLEQAQLWNCFSCLIKDLSHAQLGAKWIPKDTVTASFFHKVAFPESRLYRSGNLLVLTYFLTRISSIHWKQ